jgi:uncharacterized protein YqjF (DUF2071 family)
VRKALSSPTIGVKMEWRKLLFMHWPVPPECLRPLIPPRLTVDTFDGSAYVALVPFTMTGIRWSYTPKTPWISSFHEFNVRTYVHLDGRDPGVWFFSLDAARLAAVWAARTFFSLPYYHAKMHLDIGADRIAYSSQRFSSSTGRAFFRGTYGWGDALPRSTPGSLVHFLTERYCLYSRSRTGAVHRARVWHDPWSLHTGRVFDFESDLLEVAGVPMPKGEPLLHYADYLATWSGLPQRC